MDPSGHRSTSTALCVTKNMLRGRRSISRLIPSRRAYARTYAIGPIRRRGKAGAGGTPAVRICSSSSMELLGQQILAGIATGAIYACMALAVVMIYQAIDHLNFAQGEMAMFSTFIAFQLMLWGLPYWAAFPITLVVSFIGGVLIDRVVFKPIHDAPILSHVVVFIALLAILNSTAGFIWDFTVKSFPSPFGSAPLFGSSLIRADQAGMIGVRLLLLVFLVVFFC